MNFNSTKNLYINIIVSKIRGSSNIVYHLKSNTNPNKEKKINLELVLFLSRILNNTELRH